MQTDLCPDGELTQVCFVHDYVQLHFQGHCLTLNNAVRFEKDDSILLQGEPGFCDALVALIGLKAKAVRTKPLTIDFELGVRIIVQGDGDSIRGPEAWAMYPPSGTPIIEHN